MGKPRLLLVTDLQVIELVRVRDTAPQAYVRERAAAILKISAGAPAAIVARGGLLRPRKPDTLYDWMTRFERRGIAGLIIIPGRGRKPAFSPSVRRPRPRGCPGQGQGGAPPHGTA